MPSFEATVYRLLVAFFCGALIGVERERHGRPAGLRTHILVAVGSAAFTIVSIQLPYTYHTWHSDTILRADLARIAAQIVSGIGFLGAGAIIQTRKFVTGLTTAACLWIAAAIGMTAGIGNFPLAGVVTGLSLASLYLMKAFEQLIPRDHYHHLTLKCHFRPELLQSLEKSIRDHGIKIISFNFVHDKATNLLTADITIRNKKPRLPDELLHYLLHDPDIITTTWA
ncbi:MAG: MgtC/SapB family protein [Deltaproteobacteria bacterium]|nr:MgtC/SapB family protein [Deltaproteobacteria bacterium]